MNLELTVETLAFGGKGVARHQGKAIFIPLTAPGDHIRCRVVQDKGRYAEAELIELLDPAPQRREPPCPVFGVCGGCQWQHLPYAEQGRWKETILGDLLRRQGGIAAPPVLPLVPAPAEWHYRSRVQFKCRQTEAGFVMGFYRRGSHYVIDVAHCPITDERLNGALSLFRQWLPAAPAPACIPQVDLAVGDDGAIRAVVHCIGKDAGALSAWLRPLAQRAGIALFLQQGRKETLTPVCGAAELDIVVDEPPLSLAYGPGGFAQVNLEQNRRMVQAVVEAADLTGRERVLDLYCGMGNFSLPLARRARQVIGVEDYAPAIDQARLNARRHGIENARFEAAPAEMAAARLAGGDPVDLVLLDPPRGGAFPLIKELSRLLPRRILYVSCDPATLARDLKPLLHGGYLLRWSRPFDLFPQTGHIESISCLERRQPDRS
ncbi:MAG: 23S rRNA (uracil(1939)-C(5))-methyltransferase RlmD [Desulfuromonadales bacterium]